MRRSVVVLVAFFAFSSIVFASQPGQPLDCSDWVMVDPTIRCREFTTCGTEPTTGNRDFPCFNFGGKAAAISPDGFLLGVEQIELPLTQCGDSGTFRPGRIELKLTDGSVERLLGYVETRCCPDGLQCRDTLGFGGVEFDAVNGRLLVLLDSECQNAPGCEYVGRLWVASFEGFATLFDVIESFTPSTGDVGFRVPQRPEALGAADRFDTFWGQVTRPIDSSQAHPLQCAYPDHQPRAGEYLTFPNSAPTPAPGQAVYYLTAVSYQGQTRAGRKAIDGRLSGREATQLPPCTLER